MRLQIFITAIFCFLAFVSTTKTLERFDNEVFKTIVRSQVMDTLEELKLLDTVKTVASSAINGTLKNTTSELLTDSDGLYTTLKDVLTNETVTDFIEEMLQDPQDTIKTLAKNVTKDAINVLLDEVVTGIEALRVQVSATRDFSSAISTANEVTDLAKTIAKATVDGGSNVTYAGQPTYAQVKYTPKIKYAIQKAIIRD